MLVVGCGPRPHLVRGLLDRGFEALGIEPVRSFVEAAQEFIGPERIVEAPAEDLAIASNSQDLVLCQSVLEHVDSPERSLAEAFRVLRSGGALWVCTTNRHRFIPTGRNGEYNVRFYNWLPAVVKESFVFQHLHYDPTLANWSLRPAVHWFTYGELCRLGRGAGFHQFCSALDMLGPSDPALQTGRVRRLVRERVRFNPWMRALALTQRGETVVMLKRSPSSPRASVPEDERMAATRRPSGTLWLDDDARRPQGDSGAGSLS